MTDVRLAAIEVLDALANAIPEDFIYGSIELANNALGYGSPVSDLALRAWGLVYEYSPLHHDFAEAAALIRDDFMLWETFDLLRWPWAIPSMGGP